MPCYHPLTAYRSGSGAITFNEGGDSGPPLELPCGRCIGCRRRRTREWALRCLHEAATHDTNCFVTLTYDENHHEHDLRYRDFQDFIRRLRKAARGGTVPIQTDPRPRKGHVRIRYFVAGEYGETTKRPHWHALLFGANFGDQYPVGKDLYGSKTLDEIWGKGFASIGEVNYTTASYVAAYCIKKINGPQAAEHYKHVNLDTGEILQVQPEMARMSLKPGIGYNWYIKYQKETHYARDGVVQQGGQTLKTPRYYDKILEKQDIKQYMEIETNRINESNKRQGDNTKQRLKDREICDIAKQSTKQRKL